MLKNVKFCIKDFFDLFIQKRITRAAAALSYYLTMTVFPLVICVYTLLGNRYDEAMRILNFIESFIPPSTIKFIEDFLLYIATNHNMAMLFAGLTVVITSASAAYRTIHYTIGEVQGKIRFQGIIGLTLSVVFSLAFVLMVYFGVIVMLTGRSFIAFLNHLIPFIDIGNSWNWLRFVILFAIAYILISCIYASVQPKREKYPIFAGSFVGTFALVIVSIVFSVFISASAKYPLVYGSLASVVLIMFWLYLSCIVLLCGAVLNVVMRDMHAMENKEEL